MILSSLSWTNKSNRYLLNFSISLQGLATRKSLNSSLRNHHLPSQPAMKKMKSLKKHLPWLPSETIIIRSSISYSMRDIKYQNVIPAKIVCCIMLLPMGTLKRYYYLGTSWNKKQIKEVTIRGSLPLWKGI